MAVLGAGRCLRMVLDRECRQAVDPDPLVGAVEQRHVGLDHMGRQVLAVDGEAVVLAGDLDLPRLQVLDRMVGAAPKPFIQQRVDKLLDVSSKN